MPRQQIREIMDELNKLGGMTPAHMVLITELVAVCLAAGPKPQPIHPDVEAAEERRARDRERKRVSRECPRKSEESVVYNNINNSLSGKGGVGGKPIPRNRGTRLPDPWDPPENLWEQAKKETGMPDADLRFETKKFRDHFWSVPGQKGLKLDWGKTWMNWMRNNKSWSKKPKNNVVEFVSSGPKRSWAEIKAEKEKSQ